MRRRRAVKKAVRHISADPNPVGIRAVYMVETKNEREAREVSDVFREFEPHVEVRQLSRGRLVSYAVQLRDEDQSILDEIDAVLKGNFGFVIMHRAFDDTIHKVVIELCKDTASKLLPIPRCHICDRHDPFPEMVVSLADEAGEVMLERTYCRACTAGTTAKDNKQFVLSLLSADKKDFGDLSHAELISMRAGKHSMRFRVEPAQDNYSTTG